MKNLLNVVGQKSIGIISLFATLLLSLGWQTSVYAAGFEKYDARAQSINMIAGGDSDFVYLRTQAFFDRGEAGTHVLWRLTNTSVAAIMDGEDRVPQLLVELDESQTTGVSIRGLRAGTTDIVNVIYNNGVEVYTETVYTLTVTEFSTTLTGPSTGVLGSEAPQPFSVRILRNGAPFSSASVDFFVEGSGTLSNGDDYETVVPVNGVAETKLTPNTTSQVAVAYAVYLNDCQTNFCTLGQGSQTLNAYAPVLQVIEYVGGEIDDTGGLSAIPLTQAGAAISGLDVEFIWRDRSIVTGDGSVDVDFKGYYLEGFTFGPNWGSTTVIARLVDYPQYSELITVETLTPPVLMTKVSADSVDWVTDLTTPEPFTVSVTQGGQPVTQANVDWTISPNGSIGEFNETAVNGVYSIQYSGKIEGSYIVTASIPDTNISQSFDLELFRPQISASLSNISRAVNQTQNIDFTVVNGNVGPMNGERLLVSMDGGNTVATVPASVTTGSNGVATVSVQLGDNPGSDNLRVSLARFIDDGQPIFSDVTNVLSWQPVVSINPSDGVSGLTGFSDGVQVQAYYVGSDGNVALGNQPIDFRVAAGASGRVDVDGFPTVTTATGSASATVSYLSQVGQGEVSVYIDGVLAGDFVTETRHPIIRFEEPVTRARDGELQSITYDVFAYDLQDGVEVPTYGVVFRYLMFFI